MTKCQRSIPWVLAALIVVPAIAAEGRTPVYLDGTVIAADGRYVLTRNIASSGAGTPVIMIQAPNVDLDLNGFTIFGAPGVPCIDITVPPIEVKIHDGTLVGGDYSIVRFPIGPGRTVIIERIKSQDAIIAAIELNDVEAVAIRRTTIIDSGGEGIRLPGPLFKQGSISDNTIKRTGGDGIYVDTSASLEIVRNQLEVIGTSAAGGYGVRLLSSVGDLVAENVISDPHIDGILLRNSRGNKVRNNVVRHAFQSCFRVDPNSSDNFIIDNVGTECGFDTPPGHGLHIEGYRNHVEGNTLNGNSTCGLLFDVPSFGNIFGRNMARGNGGVAPCGPCPLLFPPDSCDASAAGNDSNQQNMIPGPPPF